MLEAGFGRTPEIHHDLDKLTVFRIISLKLKHTSTNRLRENLEEFPDVIDDGVLAILLLFVVQIHIHLILFIRYHWFAGCGLRVDN